MDSAERNNLATSANFAASHPTTFLAEVTSPAAEWEAKAAARQASVHDDNICAIGISEVCERGVAGITALEQNGNA